MTKKVLVTGGTGFIGSNVVDLLVKRAYDVTIIDNLVTGYQKNLEDIINEVNIVEGDIRDKDLVNKQVEKVDGIFHLAAIVGNIKSIENPVEDAEVNVIGTLNLLNAAKEHEISKFVFSSSGAIFGEVCYLPVDEKHPAEPDSPYGVTKLASEKHCLCYSRLYDMNIVCLRYFNVYGQNQRYDPYGNIIPIWTGLLLKNEPFIIYGDGEQTRDFINVKDVAMANIQAFETPGISGPFNIGSGSSITINQLADIFKNVTGEEIKVEYKPSRKGEVKHSEAKIDGAKKAFNFEPQISLEEGIKEYIDWIKSINIDG
jgi:UDP-glucose 4-epimerase